MKIIRQTNSFKKDLKKAAKRAKNLNKLYLIVERLASGQKLEAKNKEHALLGNYIGKLECHIEPDWLMIYEVTNELVILYRTGSHSDLFK